MTYTSSCASTHQNLHHYKQGHKTEPTLCKWRHASPTSSTVHSPTSVAAAPYSIRPTCPPPPPPLRRPPRQSARSLRRRRTDRGGRPSPWMSSPASNGASVVSWSWEGHISNVYKTKKSFAYQHINTHSTRSPKPKCTVSRELIFGYSLSCSSILPIHLAILSRTHLLLELDASATVVMRWLF
jgi:hypothetical protein